MQPEPGEDGAHRDRQDERWQPDVRDQRPIGESQRGADRQRRENREQGAEADKSVETRSTDTVDSSAVSPPTERS